MHSGSPSGAIADRRYGPATRNGSHLERVSPGGSFIGLAPATSRRRHRRTKHRSRPVRNRTRGVRASRAHRGSEDGPKEHRLDLGRSDPPTSDDFSPRDHGSGGTAISAPAGRPRVDALLRCSETIDFSANFQGLFSASRGSFPRDHPAPPRRATTTRSRPARSHMVSIRSKPCPARRPPTSRPCRQPISTARRPPGFNACAACGAIAR